MDALLPPEMADKAVQIGVGKAGLDATSTFVLGVLAGAFIGLGAVFATTAAAGAGDLPFGVARTLVGVVFSLGLVLVVVGGAELFTGNNLVIMAWASGRVKTRALLRNWALVFAGNTVGAVGTAALVFAAAHHELGGAQVGAAALAIAESKLQLGFVEAVARGILCNALVCLAVWLTFSARTVGGKILAIVPPIAAFVAAGFEHSIANLYFVPVALMIQAGAGPEFWAALGQPASDFVGLSLASFLLHNLLPVTLGNILGGAGLVGGVYWLVYLRPRRG